ncbi:MAG: HAMP domain-containing sensor histidine kinase, partial [Pseudomonadota bacterium]
MARTAGEKADAALARAERILAQLLMMARVDVAEGRLQPDLQDVAALARDLTAEMVPVAAAAGIDLGYAGAERALIRAEPVLLAEMLRNLLDNALAYAGRGAEVTVRVTVGDSVKVTVEDNGPGIPADRRAALLTRRAAQSDTVGTEVGGAGGFGIGLTIVAEIARLFGGKLILKDGTDGRGLTAELAFPGM